MDEQIKKAFDRWAKEVKWLSPNLGVKDSALLAFEEGWAQGIASMMDTASQSLLKAGRVRADGVKVRPTFGKHESGIDFEKLLSIKKKGRKNGRADD